MKKQRRPKDIEILGRGRVGGRLLFPAFLCAMLALGACSEKAPDPGSSRFVVVGIDGAEWSVIRKLWDEGKLSNFKALADRGFCDFLQTHYGESPVIWTTIATGRTPSNHGITGFVVATPNGDVPVSSTVRKAPAIWNMLTAAKRRVAVLGWWASWPAESINGPMLTDRPASKLDARVHPKSLTSAVEDQIQLARQDRLFFKGEEVASLRDEVAARYARRLFSESFDLVLIYFRSLDVISHHYWKYYEPQWFESVDPQEVETYEKRIPDVYASVDSALGEIVRQAGADANFLVISDHGFHASKPEQIRVALDLDPVLERLGYLVRDEKGVDVSRSVLYSYKSASHQTEKQVRFASTGRESTGTTGLEKRQEIHRRLKADLARITFESEAAVFRVGGLNREPTSRGGNFVVEVLRDSPSRTLIVNGTPLKGAVRESSRVSGGHRRNAHGIFIAAGPDIDPGAGKTGMTIHDVAPTLLAGLGLPVAEDFDGVARMSLFTPEFRAAHPVKTIRSWGASRSGEVTSSEDDQALLEELRALGYIK